MSAKSRRRFLCVDCEVDTGKIREHYFVHTTLWLSVMPTTKGMLCVGCLEKRLGRKLCRADFPPVFINNPRFEPKSQRLMERLASV